MFKHYHKNSSKKFRGCQVIREERETFHQKSNTVHGKILEGEIFGELMALKSLARKNLANLLIVY